MHDMYSYKCVTDKTRNNVRAGLLTNAAPLLAGRLVEPGLDIVLPMLLEVAVRDNIVVLHHFDPFLPADDPPHQRKHAS